MVKKLVFYLIIRMHAGKVTEMEKSDMKKDTEPKPVLTLPKHK